MFNKKKKAADPVAKGGRPTKYEPSMCAKAEQIMMDGASKVEVAAALGICKNTLFEWIKLHPEFSDSIKRGEALSQAWWERKTRLMGEQPAGKNNAAIVIFRMKNMFEDYREKREPESQGNTQLDRLSDILGQSE
jgi:transposase-like protein